MTTTLAQLSEILTRAQIAELAGASDRTVRRWLNGEQQIPGSKRRLIELELQSRRIGHGFTFIDLFAGIGGTRLGFEAAGGRCVFTSEWDKFAQQTYLTNFGTAPDHVLAGDITKVVAEDIPDHDVVVAGFPCQPFSIAGVSKKNSLGRAHGFADEIQGTLFFDIARIIEAKQPKAFMLENVKNLQSHDRGRTFAVIIRTLREELGYDVQYQVIDASPWVPQRRRRIIIVGFRNDVVHDFRFGDIATPVRGPKMSEILHPEDGTETPEGHFTQGSLATVSEKYTLSDHLWTYLRNYAQKHRAAGNGFGFGLVGPDDVARTLSARYYKDGSEILVDQGDGLNPRRLTPRECARLMGFPDSYKIPVSDTQAYKQFGNSIVVPMVEEVAGLIATQLTAARAAA